jgi:N-acetylmuramoyl-L-alanine amidase
MMGTVKMKIVISSGHGKHIRGARGNPVPPQLDEVDEARRVVEHVADYLGELGVSVMTYHDDVSTTQDENLHRIVDFHNSQTRDLDVSVHFNAYQNTSKPMGCEVLYVSQEDLAKEVSRAIADAGDFIDRGAKKRTDLFVLNNTEEPCILIETCFVDSSADAALYRQNFDLICNAIAGAIAGEDIERPAVPEPPSEIVDEDALLHVRGSCSWFGGPDDDGVDVDEGLAFFYELNDAPHLFLPSQPAGTTGLARRLDPGTFYIACRWDYDEISKDMLRDQTRKALVRAKGLEFLAYPADWGPHESTGRVADLSPALIDALGLSTDDEVEVIYPAPQE